MRSALSLSCRYLAEAALAILISVGAALAQSGSTSDPAALFAQAQALYVSGKYVEAARVFEETVDVAERLLGPDHPNVGGTRVNLGEAYRALGRYREAQEQYERAVAIFAKQGNDSVAAVGVALGNLAIVLANQGRYVEADGVYRRALEIKIGVLGPDHPDVAQILNNLGELYRVQARFDDAMSLYTRALGILEKSPERNPLAIASVVSNVGAAYLAQGRYIEAEPPLKRSLELRQASGLESPDLVVSLNNLGELYRLQGRYDLAGDLFREALRVAEKALGPNHLTVAAMLHNLATIAAANRRLADADRDYRRALEIRFKVLGAHPLVSETLNNIGELYGSVGEFADAQQAYQAALEIARAQLGANHPTTTALLNNMGAAYLGQGDVKSAEAAYGEALEARKRTLGAEHPEVGVSLANLAELEFAQKRFAEARSHSRGAVDILVGNAAAARSADRARRQLIRRVFLQHLMYLKPIGSTPQQPPVEDLAEGFDIAQQALASDAAAALTMMSTRLYTVANNMSALIRESQDLEQEIGTIDTSLVKAVARPPDMRDASGEAALRTQYAAAKQRLRGLYTEIEREFPQYAELSQRKPLGLNDAQSILEPDEALLLYVVAPDRTWAWALRKDKAELIEIAIGERALGVEVAALRNGLDPTFNPNRKPFDATRAYELHQKILTPAAPLLEGARHVFVVPDGALESLPIGVLVTEPPKADADAPADHRDIAWFAKKYAVTVLPSVGSLRALRQFTANARAASPFVGVGNPALEGKPGTSRGVKLASLFRGSVADVAVVRQLEPLPETEDELRAVARSLAATDNDLYLGKRATEKVLRAGDLSRYRVVHFATHGLMSGDLQGLAEPALVLTPPPEATPDDDGLLTASEVATLKLNADWVVLSACNTAAADGTPDAGGLSGLAKAFFYAGARSLLVSHWSVPSTATVKLVTGAFEELRKDPGIGRAEALRRAQIAMMDPSNPPEFSHPLAWAPFVLAGEGGAGR